MAYIFVYGTLRSGQYYHHLIEKQIQSIQKATVEGLLFDLPYGYPAVIEGTGRVVGELFTFENHQQALCILDELEDYHGPGKDNEYERIETLATLDTGQHVPCQMYVYSASKEALIKEKGIFVSHGDWVLWKSSNGNGF
ncbi:gamma-glutamylcyclotransferase [Ammoniphilus sp. YIM 78166]|uniref:gamma-glutamylcyclotransferase family protein n=1 Tax=Ammoniphilus sp. YIM 78166 TaxID=1644106 RepID=UPI00107012E7|nr:gamma-glutamylcyclotransferase [Ammoniphilus sp. YIM 78166]